MDYNFKKHFSTFAFVFLGFYFLFFILAPSAFAQFGLKETAEKAGLISKGGTVPSPAAMAGTIIGYVLAFVGVIFFALMIYGGFLWMTARGNEELVKKAKNILEAAIIGIVIIFLAYTVTNFVVSRLTAGAGVPTP